MLFGLSCPKYFKLGVINSLDPYAAWTILFNIKINVTNPLSTTITRLNKKKRRMNQQNLFLSNILQSIITSYLTDDITYLPKIEGRIVQKKRSSYLFSKVRYDSQLCHS